MHSVRVNRKAADRVASGHPWIFSSDVADRGGAGPGDAVVVVDPRGRQLGTAHHSSTSQIALRMLDSRPVAFDQPFLTARLQSALGFRDRVVKESTACRLVHSEADRLPGLVIDRYGDYLVMQLLDQGMDCAGELIVETLQQLLHPAAIVARNDTPVRRHESLPLEKKVAWGEVAGPVEVRMNGLRWRCDLLDGQKTGVFLDQRENYVAAASHSHGQALDCFTCAGGFALHLAARCSHVEAVDSSAGALETGRANRDANGIGNVDFREAEVFDLLASYAKAHRRFDTIVLDPPAFAKSRGSVEGAVRGYHEINRRALELLGPGGVLITCSCSHHVSEAMLLETVARASLEAGRTLRVLDRRTQSADHPILLTVPETHYLKCVILEVV